MDEEDKKKQRGGKKTKRKGELWDLTAQGRYEPKMKSKVVPSEPDPFDVIDPTTGAGSSSSVAAPKAGPKEPGYPPPAKAKVTTQVRSVPKRPVVAPPAAPKTPPKAPPPAEPARNTFEVRSFPSRPVLPKAPDSVAKVVPAPPPPVGRLLPMSS